MTIEKIESKVKNLETINSNLQADRGELRGRVVNRSEESCYPIFTATIGTIICLIGGTIAPYVVVPMLQVEVDQLLVAQLAGLSSCIGAIGGIVLGYSGGKYLIKYYPESIIPNAELS